MFQPEIIGIGVMPRDLTVVVDRAPGPDEKVPAREFHESGGGPVPAALVTLARWGRRVALAGVVGADPSGEAVLDELAGEGVDVSLVERVEGFQTPVSVITVQPPHRSICEVGQAAIPDSGHLSPDLRSQLDRCRYLLVDGRLPALQTAAARLARAAGAIVVLDAGRPRPGIDTLLALTDVAIVSHTYLRAVGWPEGDLQGFLRHLGAQIAQDGPRIAGVTLGAHGCVLRAGEAEEFSLPGHIIEALDTTGAGDVFHGAFVHALAAGQACNWAARFANAAAALKCRGLTTRAPLPPEPQIRQFAGIEESQGLRQK